MGTYTHKIRKGSHSTTERLPDITGTPIVYSGAVNCDVEITRRHSSEPTCEAGVVATIGAYSGTIEDQTAEILPDKEVDGGIVWEEVAKLVTAGTSV